LDEHRSVFDIDYLLHRHLCDVQRKPKDVRIRFAEVEIMILFMYSSISECNNKDEPGINLSDLSSCNIHLNRRNEMD